MSLERAAKEYLNKHIYERTNGVVQSGPFKGMVVLDEVCWSDGNLGTKVLGCYEQELHDAIEREIKRLSEIEHPCIIDYGCSEGYYTVGMARRLPNANVIGIDLAKEALRITQQAADFNEVSVELLHTDDEACKGLLGDVNPDLIICDVEGAEIEYLDPEKWPVLKTVHTIIVECHDTETHQVTSVLGKRFSETHELWLATEAGRNPNEFEMLTPMPSIMRWLAVCEGRPAMMHWLVMLPKGYR
jgi:precorrin-6B methylase 2